MDRLLPPGPFASPPKISRGPWFKEWMVEDDGLEYFYTYKNADGHKKFLLTNNISIKDREALEKLYKGYNRNSQLSMAAGMWTSFELFSRVGSLRKMAYGWRALAFLAVGATLSYDFRYWTAGYYYMPIMNAYFKKYDDKAKTSLYDITDEKREWFEIDTSQYMDYTFEDLDHHHHNINHGPQPDGEALDSSWLIEMGKYLKGEENNWKDHPKFRDYKFDYSDKYQWPSTDLVHNVFNAKEKEQHTPDSLKPGNIAKPQE
jgi:hypothetical protein